MRLSDTIERFIKTMLEQDEYEIELKRNELAEYFGCAPSQINYVLSTRFTVDHGYVTESRRGGGGCIRIVRIKSNSAQQLIRLLSQRIGEAIDETDASRLLAQLVERAVLSPSQAKMISYAISPQALGVPIPDSLKDALRARIMRSMLLAAAQDENALIPYEDPQEEM